MTSPGDRSANAAAMVAAFVAMALIAQQIAGKAVRDALFLSNFPATDLPAVMIGAAVTAFLVVVLVARLLTAWSPRRVVPVALLVNAGLFVAEWALAQRQPRVAGVVVYLHTAAVGAAVVSAFWSMVNERFDPHTAKRVVARIAAGATVGGVVGGVVAWQLAHRVSLPTLLLVLAGVNAFAAFAAPAVGAGAERDPETEAGTGAIAILRETPYLRHLALLIALAAMGEAAIDYIFKATAAAEYDDSTSLVSFFALFHMITGLVTFAIQTLAAGKLLERVGLAGTVSFLPGTVLATSVAALAAPGIATAAALRGGTAAVESSLFRSGYEVMYTPLPPSVKRPTKTLIDVGCSKLGAAVGSGLVMLALFAIPAVSYQVLLGFAVVMGLLSLWVTGELQRGYVAALADSLRSGALVLDEAAMVDATTRATVADTMSLNRDALLAEIERMRSARSGDAAPAATAPSAGAIAPADDVTAAVADLRSGDPARVSRVLGGVLDVTLIGHVIPLLTRDELAVQVVAALKPHASRGAGQLVDAMLDPASDVRIRRRVPRVLAVSRSQRAVDGLLLGLEDPRFSVRYRCAAALMRVTARHPKLGIDRKRVIAAVHAEGRRSEDVRASASLDSVADDESSLFEQEAATRQVSRTLTYFFTLLSLVLDREPLHLAFCALATDDPNLRGTGLEYLENVVPSELREVLAPFVGDREVVRKAPRPKQQVLDDLMSSRDSMRIDLEALRKIMEAG